MRNFFRRRQKVAPSTLGELLTRPLEQGEVSLAELLQALYPAEERERRELVRSYVTAIRTATNECLRAQGHLFAVDPEQRVQALNRLADSLLHTDTGYWKRFGVTRQVVEAIGGDILTAVVRATAAGSPTLSLEGRAYEYLSSAAGITTGLPSVRGGATGHQSVASTNRSAGAAAASLPTLRLRRRRDAAAR